MKTLRNFLLANLCAVLSLWWALFGWMPDQVRMYMRGTNAPGSIVASGTALAGEDLGGWEGGRVFRFYLQKDMKWSELTFRLPGDAGTDGVSCIELQKWKLISFRKDGVALVPSGDVEGEYVFAAPGLGRIGIAAGKISLGLALLEMALLGLSWWSARRHRPEPWKTLMPPVLGVALVLTLLMQVALPVQSYLANQSSYPFSFGELFVAVAVRFAWISVLAVTAVGLLTRCFGRWVLGVVFAFAICIYLESGALSNGLASLNGDIWSLLNPKRALWDATVWAGVFATIAAAHIILRKHYGVAAVCLMVMVAASMLDVKREKPVSRSGLIVDDFVPFGEVIRNVAYSTNQNVFVFILDSLEREQAHAIMDDPEEGSALREKFRGFTEYTNNVGALPQTRFAVPNLLTGRYPDGTIPLEEYFWTCYASESALQNFLKAGHDVFMTTPGLECGYTNKKNMMDEKPRRQSVFTQSGNDEHVWSLADFVRWRWLPFAAKASCTELQRWNSGGGDSLEWAVYPELSKAETNPESPGVFLWVHTRGVHVPIGWNRRGELLPEQGVGEQSFVEQGVFVLQCLGELLDSFRQRDIYDKSLILVLGDHGRLSTRTFYQDQQDGRLPKCATPCLWVKPVGSTHEFTASEIPTSHANVADVLKVAARSGMTETEIQERLQSDERIYRHMALLGGGWTDWIVKRDGSFSIRETTPFDIVKPSGNPLECGRLYSLEYWSTTKIQADLFFAGSDIEGYPFMYRDKQKISIGFRVPDAGKSYVLRLELYDGEGGRLRFRCETADGEWQEFPVKPFARIDIRNVKADATGMARVVCERVPGPSVDVAFVSLRLDESP